jgi:hypothetical protein
VPESSIGMAFASLEVRRSQGVLGRVDEGEARGVKPPGGCSDGTRGCGHREGRVLLSDAGPVVLVAGIGSLSFARSGHRQGRGTGPGHRARPVRPLMGVEENADVRVSGFEGDLKGRAAVDVEGRRVAVRLAEEQPHYVGVSVFRGAHQRRAAVLVLEVHGRPGLQQQSRHVLAPVGHGEHEGSLAVLKSNFRILIQGI